MIKKGKKKRDLRHAHPQLIFIVPLPFDGPLGVQDRFPRALVVPREVGGWAREGGGELVRGWVAGVLGGHYGVGLGWVGW